jgi:hypothetical protein
MTRITRTFIVPAALAAAAIMAVSGESQAGWGHYRAVTSYSVPSVPVYSPPVVMESTYRPVVVAPAPVVVSRPVYSARVVVSRPVYSAPVVVSRPVYSAPVVVDSPVVSAPVAVTPAPQTTYYLPATAPAVVVPQPVVRQTVVSRPALFGPRVRTTYYAPSVVLPAPVFVP